LKAAAIHSPPAGTWRKVPLVACLVHSHDTVGCVLERDVYFLFKKPGTGSALSELANQPCSRAAELRVSVPLAHRPSQRSRFAVLPVMPGLPQPLGHRGHRAEVASLHRVHGLARCTRDAGGAATRQPGGGGGDLPRGGGGGSGGGAVHVRLRLGGGGRCCLLRAWECRARAGARAHTLLCVVRRQRRRGRWRAPTVGVASGGTATPGPARSAPLRRPCRGWAAPAVRWRVLLPPRHKQPGRSCGKPEALRHGKRGDQGLTLGLGLRHLHGPVRSKSRAAHLQLRLWLRRLQQRGPAGGCVRRVTARGSSRARVVVALAGGRAVWQRDIRGTDAERLSESRGCCCCCCCCSSSAFSRSGCFLGAAAAAAAAGCASSRPEHRPRGLTVHPRCHVAVVRHPATRRRLLHPEARSVRRCAVAGAAQLAPRQPVAVVLRRVPRRPALGEQLPEAVGQPRFLTAAHVIAPGTSIACRRAGGSRGQLRSRC
jgi:hypothetical protein